MDTKITLFHGSEKIIETPTFGMGRKNNDFGLGFYCTESEKLEFAVGAMLRIKGKNVSFDAEDEVQGVFLVSSDATETRVSNYNRIGTNVIEAYVPAVVAGSYEIKLVTKPGTERCEKAVSATAINVTA